MKEYEKFAEEWCSQFETKNSGRDAYQAGFLTARRLALDELTNDAHFAHQWERLKKLGEKEV